MRERRVVITGMSALTPIGNNVAESWDNLLKGVSGIALNTAFDTTAYDTKIAGELKKFDPCDYMSAKEAKRMDRFSQIAVAAAKELIENSAWDCNSPETDNLAVILGCGLGGLATIENFHTLLLNRGPSKASPFYIPMLISNMAPGLVAMAIGAKGVNFAVTSACASGSHAIGAGFSEILLGRIDAAVVGGVEATITPLATAGFNALKALSVRNDEPTKASRPFDAERSGFVMGEGAGFLFLESLESAKARGAKIYAEIVGYGASDDAYHMTSPDENGAGAIRAMERALKDADIKPEDISFINAHGTSTKMNDRIETFAIKQVFKDHAYKIPVISNKSQIGHLLGAAGGVEAVFSIKTLMTGIIPGTSNLENPDPDCDLDYVPDGPRKINAIYGLSNSFGFGGTNVSVIFKKYID